MGRRGPKSAAEIADSIQKTNTDRLPPPARLNAAGKKRWWEIVDEHVPERFTFSDQNTLADMIVSEQYIADCDRKLGRLKSHLTPKGKIHPLVALRDKHIKAMVLLQRALRLCPSMRVRQDKVGLAGKPGAKPWEKK